MVDKTHRNQLSEDAYRVCRLAATEHPFTGKYNDHWLDGVYVPSEHRGKGISTLLINFANNTAKECGVKDLYLRCEEHNVKLYEKYGYKVVLTEENKSIMKRVIND